MTQISEQQQARILKALEHAANHEVWNKTTFLRAIGKKIASLRDAFKQLIAPTSTLSHVDRLQAATQIQTKTPVFVSLYCANGTDLAGWERVLVALPTQLMSRPIYAEEMHVIELIKSKTKKENEAYVRVEVPSDTIVMQTHPILDKFNHPLTTLRGQALSAEFKAEFVHQSNVYQYDEKKLILKASL